MRDEEDYTLYDITKNSLFIHPSSALLIIYVSSMQTQLDRNKAFFVSLPRKEKGSPEKSKFIFLFIINLVSLGKSKFSNN
jgi:hypothetical protein